MNEVLWIAGSRDPLQVDYAAHCALRKKLCVVDESDLTGRQLGGVVVFLDRRLSAREQEILGAVAETAIEGAAGCVCIVSSFRVHLGDRDAIRAEIFLLRQLRGFPGRVVVFRPGHVLSRHSSLGVFLRRSWYWYPLVPRRLTSCCVEAEELFVAIDRELAGTGRRKSRTFALLGENRPWYDRLREQGKGWLASAYAALAGVLLPLAALRLLGGLLFALAARRSPHLRAWHVGTLRPRSIKELLTLYNPYNFRHVKVVGYNNGVIHFGQQFPGRTVVSTVACNRLARLKGGVGEFDTGVTVRQATDVLAQQGRELHVLPNYSYVSMGTAYFIPIHGSASTFSTVGETIEKVILYDPTQDRCLTANRKGAAFGHYLYNLDADVLLLRVSIKTKDKSRYFVKQLRSADPSSGEILGFFHDRKPSNVEVRKAGSAAQAVDVYKYYTEPASGDGAALEVPRDSLGRLWDRLEENPVSSVLFHALVRSLAYHVELFLSEQEFATFWETHRALPILKIQLRFIRRDGFPHSPFREQDCVSADLFMRRKHRGAFEAYRRETLGTAKTNPGKHSA
jgi:hypothetical protein